MWGAIVADGLSGSEGRWPARFGAIVGGYLRSAGGISPGACAKEFTEPIDHAFLRSGAGEARIEGMLWPAWQAVISAADTPDEDARSRLVELLGAIRSQGTLVRPDGQECVVWDMRAHADLPVFGAQMRETWNSAPARPAQSWANLNAFAAQLTAAGIDFSLYGIWALRDALEEDGPEIAQVLPAAVQWLRHAGPVLASLAAEHAADARGRDQVGRLGREAGLTSHGLTIWRWNFWRRRLNDLTAAGGEIAAKACEGLRNMDASGGQISG